MFQEISKVTVKLSGYCNLACEYCHQLTDDKKKHDELDEFERIIRFLEKVNLAEEVEVTLTGGEITTMPHQYMRAWKAFQKLARKRDVNFVFAVVSNGTNADQLIEWWDRKMLHPKRTTISWDGIYSMSKSRKSKDPQFTDESMKDTIRKIGASRYATQASITHAIAPTTIPYLAESFRFAVENGIRNIGFYYIHEANYENKQFEAEFDKQVDLLGQLFMEKYIDVGTRYVYYNWQLLDTKLGPVSSTCEQMDMVATTKCHKLGKTLHFDQYGDIYGCIYFGDHRALKLGDVFHDGLDSGQLKKFNDNYLQTPSCSHNSCGNPHCFECPASSYVHKGQMMKRFANTCHLLTTEREVYKKYRPELYEMMNKYDAELFWLDRDHLGSKNYMNKVLLEHNTGVPVLAEDYLAETAPIHSSTEKRVTFWMKQK